MVSGSNGVSTLMCKSRLYFILFLFYCILHVLYLFETFVVVTELLSHPSYVLVEYIHVLAWL